MSVSHDDDIWWIWSIFWRSSLWQHFIHHEAGSYCIFRKHCPNYLNARTTQNSLILTPPAGHHEILLSSLPEFKLDGAWFGAKHVIILTSAACHIIIYPPLLLDPSFPLSPSTPSSSSSKYSAMFPSRKTTRFLNTVNYHNKSWITSLHSSLCSVTFRLVCF